MEGETFVVRLANVHTMSANKRRRSQPEADALSNSNHDDDESSQAPNERPKTQFFPEKAFHDAELQKVAGTSNHHDYQHSSSYSC